jgi:hypothetical protein
MKDQHKKIKGYRDLTEMEIELMNELKFIEANFINAFPFSSTEELANNKETFTDKLDEVVGMRYAQMDAQAEGTIVGLTKSQLDRSIRYIGLSTANIRKITLIATEGELSPKAYLEQAAMWAVRAVALPDALEV